MKFCFYFLALGVLTLFPQPTVLSGAVPPIWPASVLLQAGQHVHTPRHYGDFELTFRAKIKGRLVINLPRAAHLEFRADNSSVVDPNKITPWIVGLPPGASMGVRLVRVGSVTDLWIDGVRQSGPDCLGNPLLEGGWDDMAKSGPLVFEARDAPAELVQVMVRELETEEAVAYLSGRGSDQRKALRIAEDMVGWAGATEAVEIRDGMMTWKEGERGKILYWADALRDFEFEFEFKLTPGANNGVVLRYSGSGRAIHSSICEIQIVDQDYAAVSKPIDFRKTHGSAYGMVAARQGYQHSVGDWNYQKITLHGSQVVVELNGTRILDADLRAIPEAELLGGKRLDGLERESGYVGFAGHGDPISFRNIFVRELER